MDRRIMYWWSGSAETALIYHARQLADHQVTMCLMSQSRPVEFTTLAPDQLLDLLAEENPTNSA